jgi:hypothetical protein
MRFREINDTAVALTQQSPKRVSNICVKYRSQLEDIIAQIFIKGLSQSRRNGEYSLFFKGMKTKSFKKRYFSVQLEAF